MKLLVTEHGLGDTLTLLHYANKLFKTERGYILQSSYRNEYQLDLLKLFQPYLNYEIIEDTTLQSQFNINIDSITKKYNQYEIFFMRPEFNEQACIKTRFECLNNKFDYTSVHYKSSYDFSNYVIFSVHSIGKDRVVNNKYWKQWELEIISKGMIPVFIGKTPTNPVDTHRKNTNLVTYTIEQQSVDLRNKTNIEDVFHLINNSEQVYCTCDAIAVIAYELNKPCITFGRYDRMYMYDNRFFIKRNSNFKLLNIEDYK